MHHRHSRNHRGTTAHNRDRKKNKSLEISGSNSLPRNGDVGPTSAATSRITALAACTCALGLPRCTGALCKTSTMESRGPPVTTDDKNAAGFTVPDAVASGAATGIATSDATLASSCSARRSSIRTSICVIRGSIEPGARKAFEYTATWASTSENMFETQCERRTRANKNRGLPEPAPQRNNCKQAR